MPNSKVREELELEILLKTIERRNSLHEFIGRIALRISQRYPNTKSDELAEAIFKYFLSCLPLPFRNPIDEIDQIIQMIYLEYIKFKFNDDLRSPEFITFLEDIQALMGDDPLFTQNLGYYIEVNRVLEQRE